MQQKPDDPVTRLRERADNMATSAAAMKKIADAADPLYKTLDDGQKRRLTILTHHGGRFGGEGLAAPRLRARHDGRRPGPQDDGSWMAATWQRPALAAQAFRPQPRNFKGKPPDSGGFSAI